MESIVKDSKFLHYLKQLNNGENERTIRFFGRKGGYSIHGKDAMLANKHMTKTDMGIIRDIPTVWLTMNNYIKFLNYVLVENSYNVEIHEQRDENWLVSIRASPGDLAEVEEILMTDGTSEPSHRAGVLFLALDRQDNDIFIGLSFCDTIQQQIKVKHLLDDTSFSALQALIARINPREILIASDSVFRSQLTQLLESDGVLIHSIGLDDCTNVNLEDILPKILNTDLTKSGKSSSLNRELEQPILRVSLSALLQYLRMASRNFSPNRFSIESVGSSQVMRLDLRALEALQILPSQNKDSKSSIFGILNKTRTQGGRLQLLNWLRSPSTDKREIEKRLAIVGTFVLNDELRCSLYEDNLRRIPDFGKIAKKLSGKQAGLKDLYELHSHLKSLGALVRVLREVEEDTLRSEIVKPLSEFDTDSRKLVQMISRVIDIEKAEAQRLYFVRPQFDSALQKLRSALDSLDDEIGKLLVDVANDLNLEKGKTLKLDKTPDGNFVFRVNKKGNTLLQNNSAYEIIDVKNSGILFSTRKLTNLSREYLSLANEYQVIQKTLVSGTIDVARGYCELLREMTDIISYLDVLLSFSVCAHQYDYVKPEILEPGNDIVLEGLRHPIVEIRKSQYVSNDIKFSKEGPGFYVLTGPNMGGKSTFMRSVAVAVILAQIGSFVPCKRAIVSIREELLTRVGASDEIVRGISTFMAEMLEISTITKSATPNSLVVIDELGRGTSTFDGLGLAWAISNELATKSRCFCIFATHYHELILLENRSRGVSNIHVSARIENGHLVLLHKVEAGPSNQSFGIQVAESAALPRSIILGAKKKADNSSSMENTILLSRERTEVTKDCERIIREFCENCESIMLDDNHGPEYRKGAMESLRARIRALSKQHILHRVLQAQENSVVAE